MNRYALLAALLFGASCGANETPAPEDSGSASADPGEVTAPAGDAAPAPDFYALAVRDLAGDAFSLDPYRGQVLLLNFWATWCAPCREEIPDLMALRERLHPRGFEVIGISMDLEVEGGDVVQPFVDEFGITYPIVRGDQTTADAVGGMFGLPTTIIVDGDGNLVSRFSGLVPISEIEPLLVSLLPEP